MMNQERIERFRKVRRIAERDYLWSIKKTIDEHTSYGNGSVLFALEGLDLDDPFQQQILAYVVNGIKEQGHQVTPTRTRISVGDLSRADEREELAVALDVKFGTGRRFHDVVRLPRFDWGV